MEELKQFPGKKEIYLVQSELYRNNGTAGHYEFPDHVKKTTNLIIIGYADVLAHDQSDWVSYF